MSKRLGDVRDLDVFQSEIFEPAAENIALVGARDLAAHMDGKRNAAYAELLAALASERWRTCLLDIMRGLEDNADTDEAAASIDKAVPALLHKRRKALLRNATRPSELEPAARHALRIRAKKLRYVLEFFDEVPGLGKGASAYRRFREALEDLQASIGHIHDHEAKFDLLHDEAQGWTRAQGDTDARALFAAGVVAASTPPNFAKTLRRADHAYARLLANTPF